MESHRGIGWRKWSHWDAQMWFMCACMRAVLENVLYLFYQLRPNVSKVGKMEKKSPVSARGLDSVMEVNGKSLEDLTSLTFKGREQLLCN